jgi:hypothetical protein
MIGLKRVLAERFNVYTIDEFRTSKLHYKTEKEGSNLYVTDKKGESNKLHSVLTFQMENTRLGCINRDVNAVKNIRKLVKYYFYYHKRPDPYLRTNVNNFETVSSSKPTVNMPLRTITSFIDVQKQIIQEAKLTEIKVEEQKSKPKIIIDLHKLKISIHPAQ